MGSTLEARGDAVWVNLLRLAAGGIERLEIDDAEVEPAGLVGSAYADLATYLGRRHRVVPFPYDWRKSIRLAADALAARVERELGATEQPVRLLAHSMGGLVARAMIARHPGVWAAMKRRDGCRLLMLGTPNGGSYAIPEVLVGRDRTVRKLALVDLPNSRERVLGIIARYPGLLELLPADGDRHDYFGRQVWDELEGRYEPGRWSRPAAAALDSARTFYDEVLSASPIEPGFMGYVAGRAPFTPVGHEIEADDGRVVFYATVEGDGRVPWATGIPAALREANRVWYSEAEHGKLAAHLPDFYALRELLETGTTARLRQTPPKRRSDAPARFEMPELLPEQYPSAYGLEAALLGFEPEPAEEDAGARPVEVSVTHGNLAYARHPVVVGHFRGDGIVSAEGALDHYLGGRLSELHKIGLYPGDVGTAEAIVLDDHRPPGAVVMGLGTPGMLTAGKLVEGFTHAALLFALRWHERNRERAARATPADDAQPDDAQADDAQAPGAEPPRLSTILVGSGYGGLSTRAAVRATLVGVQQANARLRATELPDLQPIAAVEFIELYEDRAVQALQALDRLVLQDAFTGFALGADELRSVRGGRCAALGQGEADWWSRVRVRGFDHEHGAALPSLTFTALTGQARAEVQSLPTQRLLLDKLLRQAVVRPDWDDELAQTLFELLIPNEFKAYASDRRNVVWVVDQASAAYPWELLHEPMRGAREPLAVRAGMVRQLEVTQYRAAVTMTTDRRALVVGEPDLGEAAFARLPQARDEAERVAALLDADGFEVTSLLRQRDDQVLRKLLGYDYQVLHLAGHGVFEHPVEGQPPVTGMVIGPDSFLTPAIVEQMRQVPELVFVNCCHLGRVDADAETAANRHRLAANLGTQLIQMGVRAAVVAGWAVDDAAAATFADAFYEKILAGQDFGGAVRAARDQTFRRHPEHNTWGAYQCYGDPYYTLRANGSSAGPPTYRYVAPVEALIDLKNLARNAEAAASRNEHLKLRLAAIVAAVERFPAWLDRSDVLEALADAHLDLDLLPEALAYYEALTHPARSSCSTRALERLGRLHVRLGTERATRADASPADRAAGRALAERGLDRLTRLLAVDPTHERLLSVGSAYKHLARAEKHEGRDPLPYLDEAKRAYREGYEGIRQEQQGDDHYPLFNWLMLEAVHDWTGRHSPLDAAAVEQRLRLVEEARQAAADADAHDPSFWARAFDGSFHLLFLIDRDLRPASAENLAPDAAVQRKIDEHGPQIRADYERAWKRGGTYQVRRSIADQFGFLIGMLEPDDPSASRKQRARKLLADYLASIRDELERLMAA